MLPQKNKKKVDQNFKIRSIKERIDEKIEEMAWDYYNTILESKLKKELSINGDKSNKK